MLVLVLNQIEMLQLIWVRFNRCTIFPMMYQVFQINSQLATYSSCYAPGLCGSDYWYFDDAACWFYYFHDYTCSFSLFMSGTMPQAIGPANVWVHIIFLGLINRIHAIISLIRELLYYMMNFTQRSVFSWSKWFHLYYHGFFSSTGKYQEKSGYFIFQGLVIVNFTLMQRSAIIHKF